MDGTKIGAARSCFEIEEQNFLVSTHFLDPESSRYRLRNRFLRGGQPKPKFVFLSFRAVHNRNLNVEAHVDDFSSHRAPSVPSEHRTTHSRSTVAPVAARTGSPSRALV